MVILVPLAEKEPKVYINIKLISEFIFLNNYSLNFEKGLKGDNGSQGDQGLIGKIKILQLFNSMDYLILFNQ